MTFKNWIRWSMDKPLELRWFIILVLLRPIIDNLYHLKNISPFLSPPYIVGTLTPFIIIYALLRIKKTEDSPIDRTFWVWTFFTFVGTFCFYLLSPLSLKSIEFSLKLTMPIYLYFFLRIFIRSGRDLLGILQTYVYSAFFVVGLFLYEILVSPIRVEISRGQTRIQGNFADVTNYGFFVTLGFLIVAYFFFRNRSDKTLLRKLLPLVITAGLGILCLLNINHVASFGVFVSLAALFVFFNLKAGKVASVTAIGFILLALAVFQGDKIVSAIEPLIETDLAVYEGEKDSDRLFHGRVGRWRTMWDEFSELPAWAQFFGMPTSFVNSFNFISSGTHNDFLRILFFTGYFGFMTYFYFLLGIFREGLKMGVAEQFLTSGALVILLLFSVSANPTNYAPLLYIIFAIFAYLALPEERRRQF